MLSRYPPVPVHSAQLRVSTEGNGDIIDITRGVQEVVRLGRRGRGRERVRRSLHRRDRADRVRAGGVERLPGRDGPARPAAANYKHDGMPGDTNAHAHLQAAIVGPSESVPLKDGRLMTGTWQQFVCSTSTTLRGNERSWCRFVTAAPTPTPGVPELGSCELDLVDRPSLGRRQPITPAGRSLRHDRVRPHHRAVADRDAAGHHAVRAEPAVVADLDRPLPLIPAT